MRKVEHPRESPLATIEGAVQERAKALDLDMTDPDASAHLRRLVDDEIHQWSLDHARGTRPYDVADSEALAERAMRNLAGYGPLAPLLRRERAGSREPETGTERGSRAGSRQ